VTPGTPASADRRLFDVHTGAAYLREIGASSATVSFVRGLISRGEVPHVKIGKSFFVTREALDGWIGRHERRNK
jgi:excisionase family DNA binding protein